MNRGPTQRVRFARWFSAIGLVTLGLMLLQPRLVMLDQRPLLTLNDEPFDIVGGAAEILGRLLSDCMVIKQLESDSETARAALSLLRQHSPPDSLSAQLVRIDSLSDWLLIEAVFNTLPPVLVLMRGATGSVGPSGIEAIWSGTSHPWRIVPFAGAFLRAKSPEAPPELLRCARPGFR